MPPHGLTLLPVADAAHAERVAQLADRIWRAHYTPIIGAEQVTYMLVRFQSPQAILDAVRAGCRYVLAVRGDTDVGYAAHQPDPDADTLFLSKIYVDACRRRCGIGAALLANAEAHAREAGCVAVRLTVNRHNRVAITWYQRRGFGMTGCVVQDIGSGYVMDDYAMRKPLPSP